MSNIKKSVTVIDDLHIAGKSSSKKISRMVFGISIGSSTVCSSLCVSGRCQVIANAGGDHRPRAVVGKTEHDLCVGAAALSARNTPLFRDVVENFEKNGPTHMMQQQVISQFGYFIANYSRFLIFHDIFFF